MRKGKTLKTKINGIYYVQKAWEKLVNLCATLGKEVNFPLLFHNVKLYNKRI
jgi:hypothetical protein